MQLPGNGKILFIAPHPDDEVLAAGALLLSLKKQQNEIIIVYLTSGSDLSSRAAREMEARRVCEILGAKPIFKQYEVPQNIYDTSTKEKILASITELMTLIIQFSPDLIFTPSSIDPHRTHSYSSNLIRSALNRSLFTGTILEYSIWTPIPEPDVLFLFTEHLMDKKIDLMREYHSQLQDMPFHHAINGLNRYYGIMCRQDKHMTTRPYEDPDYHDEDRTEEREDGGKNRVRPMIKLVDPQHDPLIDPEYAEPFIYTPPVPDGCVLSVGDVFLDILPEPVRLNFSEASTSTSFTITPGGNAANFAAALSRLGMASALYACIGNDRRGQIIEKKLNDYGVRTYLEYTEGITATTYALSLRDGSRHFYSDFGSNLSADPTNLPHLNKGFQHLHRAGFFWMPGWIGSNERILIQAKKCGMTTSLDVGTPPDDIFLKRNTTNEKQVSEHEDSAYWKEEHRNEIIGLMQYLDIFFANEQEIMSVTQTSDIASGTDILITKGVKYVAVHQGKSGATVYGASGSYSSKAVKVVPENPTGAGDIFNAAFIYEYLNGRYISQCLDFAVAAGTLHVSSRENPYPFRSEVVKFLNVHRREQEYL